MAKRGRPKKVTTVHSELAPALRGVVDPDSIRVEEEIIQPDFKETVLEGIRKDVFLDRYSLKDEKGEATELHPDQMWWRVAKGISKIEKTPEKRKEWAKKFYWALSGFKFIPGGRILSGAGTDYKVTYYNCFVLPFPKDSRDGIIENLKAMIEIMARSGGVGINLSSLRPRGSRVQKVNGTSSGPVVWAELYSTATKDVIQQGGSRRGALMLMLYDWHPDIEEFIEVKKDLSKINGANLSVCISDGFMEAVKNDADWELVFPDIKDPDYDNFWDGDLDKWKASGKNVVTHRVVKAREMWDKICHAAWASAEPGLHFIERSNKWSNTWYFEKLVSTNPCGEQPLSPWAVCNLGALNVAAFVSDDGTFDYETLDKTARISTRFLDNVIDSTGYFYKENEINQKKNIRRTGLGTMGLGDALIKMKIRYGSDESLEVIKKIYATIRDAAYDESTELAEEKGTFGKFDKEKYLQGHFIQRLPEVIKEKIAKKGIRNAVLLTQAPTGTTSLLAGVSSGIEPVYDFSFVRRDRTGEHTIYHPLFEEWKNSHPGENIPEYFVNANDLTPEEHVKVQAAVQEFTDSSISKTVNAPNAHTVEEVKRLYTLAYELGCKGITYMRDGSRAGVLSHIEEKPEVKEEVADNGNGTVVVEPTDGIQTPATVVTEEVNVARLRRRPDVLVGSTYRLHTPVGNAFVAINSDEQGNPFEVFINVGKAGSDITADAEAMGRLISIALRIPSAYSPKDVAQQIINQLSGIGGSNSLGFGNGKVRSLADAVAKALARHIGTISTYKPYENAPVVKPLEIQEEHSTTSHTSVQRDFCPECGAASLVYEEGCRKCYSCGHSEC